MYTFSPALRGIAKFESIAGLGRSRFKALEGVFQSAASQWQRLAWLFTNFTLDF